MSSGLAPNEKEPAAAGLLAAGSATAAPPKLNDPIGAGVEVGFVASVGLAPNVKLPNGAEVDVSAGADGLPKENGAAVVVVFDTSAAGLGAPKLNGVGAAMTGVEVPESGADLRPKKFGTSPESLLGAGGAGAGAAEGLPRPKLKVGFLAVSLDAGGPPNNDAG